MTTPESSQPHLFPAVLLALLLIVQVCPNVNGHPSFRMSPPRDSLPLGLEGQASLGHRATNVGVGHAGSPLPSHPLDSGSQSPSGARAPALGVSTLNLGECPQHATYDAANGFVYVTGGVYCTGGSNVTVVNGTTILGTITVGDDPFDSTYDAENEYVYVTNRDSNSVTIINGTRVVATVDVGSTPQLILFDAKNGYVYVTDEGSSKVSIINGTSVVGTVNASASNNVQSIACDNTSGYVYVPSFTSTVSVIGGTALVGAVSVGGWSSSATYDSGDGDVYISSWETSGSGIVSIIHNTTVIGAVAVGYSPSQAVYDSQNGFVYVPNWNSANVSVINGTHLLASIGVGSGPYWSTFDSWNGYVYVSDTGLPPAPGSWNDQVSVLSGTKVILTLSVGLPGDFGLSAPSSGASDPRTGDVFIPGFADGSLTIIYPGYPVNFTETGLPRGTNWSVVLGGARNYSTSSIISFVEPNGTFSYQVAHLLPYLPDPAGGTVTVNGTDQNVSVTYSATYQATFSETGLSPGTNWSVELGGTWKESMTRNISFTEPNGSYQYSIGPIPGFQPSPSNGSLFINGSDRALPIVFTVRLFPVIFVRHGPVPAPLSSVWAVTLRGVENYSTSSSIGFEEPNGTQYAYTVTWAAKCYGMFPSSGFVNVSGAPVSVEIQGVPSYYPPCYTPGFEVNFTEIGLPSGTVWWVSLTNDSYTFLSYSNSNNITFLAPYGKYLYTVSTENKTYAALGGTIEVNGPGVAKNVSFFRVTYTVVFEATGLPAATNWSVTFNGVKEVGTSEIVFTGIPNGTYSFVVGAVTGYNLSMVNGSIFVDGRSMTQTIMFSLPHPLSTPNSSPSFLGLSGSQGYALLGGVLGAFLLGIVLGTFRKRGGKAPPELAEPPATVGRSDDTSRA
jgi:YVTN family beta-propeller protein